MAVRAPQLQLALRSFTLGAFAFLLRELDDGAELPVAFVEHEHAGGPALYEYRPLVRAFVEERAPRLRGRTDALIAIEELQREPAAAIFARAHAGPRPSEDEALFRTVLLGLLVSTAEACGGFDWDDDSFDRAYAELERSLFGERRTYTAVAPLVGISVATQLELAPGRRMRSVADGELARHWPEASSMVPKDFGRETDRYCVLELRAALAGRRGSSGRTGRDRRCRERDPACNGGAASAGPVLFETLDGRPYGIRPVLPIAATQPPGESTRLDSFRGALAGELLVRLRLADADSALAEALDRWELSLFQNEPFRSDQLRAGFMALLGETWPLRAAVLLETEPEARSALHVQLTGLAAGDACSATVAEQPAGRSSSPCSTATGPPCYGSSTRHCSACASGARSTSSPDRSLVASATTSWRARILERLNRAFEVGTESAQTRHTFRSSLHAMEEARRVIERLDRIDALDRAAAGPAELLAELRGLLHDAEAWVRVEKGDDADEAVIRLRQALARDAVPA